MWMPIGERKIELNKFYPEKCEKSIE